MTSEIAIILPPREGFSEAAFGAVSLSLRDFTRHSAMAGRLHIYGGRHEAPFSGIRYSALDVEKPWYLSRTARYLRALRRQFKANPPALIEVHNRPAIARQIARWNLAPVSLFLHNDPRDMRAANTRHARHALARDLAAVLHVSEHIRQCWQQGDATGTHHVCPLGIALPQASAPKKKQVLFVGRMVEEKGVHMLAEALAACLPEFPEWEAVFIGGRHFATEPLSAYEKQVQALLQPVWKQVDWRGFQNHDATMHAFDEAAVAVIPSLWQEPFGRIAIEAMAHGCATITSGHGGLAEIVANEAVVPTPFNAHTLAESLRTLMQDSALRETFATRARARAALFDISITARHLDAVRQSLLA